MSTIAEEIQRLKQAKSNIKTSIENKGVTVSETATLDAYPALIDSIEQTGGGFKIAGTGVKLAYSSFSEVPDGLDFEGVTDMSRMFYLCTNITTIPQIDTSSAINMTRMFEGCKGLTTIPQIDTSSVEYMSGMFRNCSSLTSIPLIDASSLMEGLSMFFACKSLTDLGGFAGLQAGVDLSVCPLTHDSIMNVINNAADVTGSMNLRLKFGSTNLAKITDEEKAIATNKGWTLA